MHDSCSVNGNRTLCRMMRYLAKTVNTFYPSDKRTIFAWAIDFADITRGTRGVRST
jgi:hypothetical protein